METLVGSKALKTHLPHIREPRDIDFFADHKIENAETFYHPSLEKWDFGKIASLDELYTIKVSHVFWDLKNGSWDKHMNDILTLQKAEAKFIPELYNILYPVWEERYGKKKANLEQEPDEFFNPNIQRVYEHDSVHDSIKYYDQPLFNQILRDGHNVAVDKNKFNALSPMDKNRLVFEEVYATALERHIIPSNYTMNARVGYAKALKQTITSFSKGWFPLHIVLNYMELRSPEINYVQRHKENSHLLIPVI